MQDRKNQHPGFYFLLCPDSALLLQRLDRELEKFPPSSGEWKKAFFWGDEPVSAKFWESLKQHGLFTENRAIIVRRAQEWPAQVWKGLDESLASGSAAIWPFFCLECELEKGRFKIPAHIQKSRCYNFAEKKRWLWNSPPLGGTSLRKHIETEAKKRKLKFNKEALDSFCSAVSPDAAAIANELDKLSLVYGESEVGPAMLELGSANTEANAFACIRNLYSGNTERVWQEIAQDGTGSLLFAIIALLARDFHLFWQIQSGLNPRLSPYDAQLKQSLARRLGSKGVGQAFVLLANAEFQVKSGKLNPDQALNQLLAELQILFASQRENG